MLKCQPMKWVAAVCGANLAILLRASVARIRGLETFMLLEPGAYAPGFTLAPAPQAFGQNPRLPAVALDSHEEADKRKSPTAALSTSNVEGSAEPSVPGKEIRKAVLNESSNSTSTNATFSKEQAYVTPMMIVASHSLAILRR